MVVDGMIKGSTGHRSHPIGPVPFEAFHNGSWRGVNSLRIRNGSLFVKFVYSGSTVEHIIHGDYLRIHSRRATCFDCSDFLKPGVDVCVRQATSTGETDASALLCRDARLIQIKRKHHTADHCPCLFAVIFYKDQCPGSKEKVIIDRITEVVTIDVIFILQKLQSVELQDGSVQWNSAEDCLRLNRSKLISTRFSAEVAYLIVLSSLRGMEFSIKMVEGNIIYQIIKGDQALYNVDSMNIPPGFGKNMEIVSFQPLDESLRPRIRTVPIIRIMANSLSEGRCITVKTELDSIQYVENLHEQVDLRRSKRLKTQPDRFTSYDAPNFNRTNKRKEEHASPAKDDNSQSSMSWDSPVQGESSDEDVVGNAALDQTVTGSFIVKEHPRPAEGQQKNPTKRTQSSLPMKENPTFVEVKKSTAEQHVPDSHIPQTPAKNRERHNSSALSFCLKSFTSSHSLYGNSEPAFCQKRGRKRKKEMHSREYKQMIDQCIGSIQWEMERDSDFKLDVRMMNCSGHNYQEEDFTWPHSANSPEKKDEHEELWKEMDYSLATLAFLEQNQMSGSEAVNVRNADLGSKGEKQCHHDCMLDEILGLTCRLCGVVCTEAKHMFPPMFTGNDNERPGRSNFCQDGDVLDSSFFEICAPEFTQFKGSGNVWNSISNLKPKLHAHQRKAFEFIWKNLAGSLQLPYCSTNTVRISLRIL